MVTCFSSYRIIIRLIIIIIVIEFQGDDDKNGDVDDADEDGDDEGGGRKHVKGIEVKVINLRHNFGPGACCLINNRTLRKLFDANDKVTHLSFRIATSCTDRKRASPNVHHCLTVRFFCFSFFSFSVLVHRYV